MYHTVEDRQKIKYEGLDVQEFLPKPVTMSDLLKLIKEHLI